MVCVQRGYEGGLLLLLLLLLLPQLDLRSMVSKSDGVVRTAVNLKYWVFSFLLGLSCSPL